MICLGWRVKDSMDDRAREKGRKRKGTENERVCMRVRGEEAISLVVWRYISSTRCLQSVVCTSFKSLQNTDVSKVLTCCRKKTLLVVWEPVARGLHLTINVVVLSPRVSIFDKKKRKKKNLD